MTISRHKFSCHESDFDNVVLGQKKKDCAKKKQHDSKTDQKSSNLYVTLRLRDCVLGRDSLHVKSNIRQKKYNTIYKL